MRFIAPFAFIAFFLSGFASLSYELTWVRLLKNVFGSDSLALSTLLTVFIGGIALGTYISGRLINKYIRKKGQGDEQEFYEEGIQEAINLGQSYILLFAYGVIELIVGLYALFVPFFFSDEMLGSLWNFIVNLGADSGFAENIIALSLTKFFISSLVLIIPTLFIGMGFPILSELLVSHQEGENDQMATSNLYATNTLGSILGALLCGFYFLPNIGLDKSVYLASIINFIIAVLVYLVFKLNSETINKAKITEVFTFLKQFLPEKKEQTKKKISQGLMQYNRVLFALILIGALLGFINLSLEVVWSKILSLIIGSSTYSVTIILAVVLAGISFGAYFLNYFIRLTTEMKISFLDSLKFGLFVFAIFITVSSSLFNQLPWLFLQVYNFFETSLALFGLNSLENLSWLFTNVAKFVLVALIVFPVTFVEGLIFAFILYLISGDTDLASPEELEPVGSRVAKASSFNTLGAIIGSFSTGFILIPIFSQFGKGLFYSIEFIVLLSYLIVVIPFYLEKMNGASKNKLVWSLSFLALIAGSSMFFLPSLNATELASGAAIYQGHKFKKITKKDYDKAIQQNILFHKEGLNNIVTVEENQSVNAIFLKNDGKIEAGIPIRKDEPSKADMLTQVFLGSLPPLLKQNASNALLIGMGSGVSLKALTDIGASTSLTEVDVCEIESLIYEAADKFFVDSYSPRIKINRRTIDARNFLAARKTNLDASQFDLIVSQPSDPWLSGSLFTLEFWQLVADNLSQDGLLVQWLQLYSIDPEYLTIALRTFQKVFPETLIFKAGNAAELILVGAKDKLNLDTRSIRALMEREEIKSQLAYIGINDDADLFANLILTPPAVAKLVGTDNNDSQSLEIVSKAKIMKFISKIPEDGVHKPKLSTDKYLKKVDAFKGRISTDDNMLLEFHTSQKLSDFLKSIKANENLLASYASPESVLEYFAENPDSSFISRLTSAHNNLVKEYQIHKLAFADRNKEMPYVENVYDKTLHGKISLVLANTLKEIYDSPASHLNLFEINLRRDEIEIADSIISDASSKFNDIFAAKKNKLVLFEGLLGNVELDAYQLYSLASLYSYNEDGFKARKIIDMAEDKLGEDELFDGSFQNLEAKLIGLKAKSYLFEFEDNIELYNKIKSKKYLKMAKRLSLRIFSNFNEAIKLDSLNPDLYLDLAEFELLKAKYFESEKDKLELAAIKHLGKITSINPSLWKPYLLLGKIYKKKLPESQMKIMEIVGDDISSPGQKNLSSTINYLKHAITLNPLSIVANYEMADLQYKLGNIDLALKHLKRLKKLCVAENLCLDKLGDGKLEKAKELHKKLGNFVLSD